ncbi:MAG: hypothetical protein OEN50_12165, partial [Deltaproteobacteria bacterium]|nr:hypothetical protein [Deltaproteobacteria bacterium]
METEIAKGYKKSMTSLPVSRHYTNKRYLLLLSISVFFVSSCSVTKQVAISPAPLENQILLFSAETAIQDDWQPVPIRGETEYRLVAVDG